MTGRSGFALPTVLWLVVALGVALATTYSGGGLASRTLENRLAAHQALWSARACLALASARFHDTGTLQAVDADLGRSGRCSLVPADPSLRIHLNRVDSAGLDHLLSKDMLAAFLDWVDPDTVPRDGGAEREWYLARSRPVPSDGPIASARELLDIRGFEEVDPAWIDALFTVDGDGRIDPNRASAAVLASLPDINGPMAAAIVSARDAGNRLDDVEEVVTAAGGTLGPASFRTLSRTLTFEQHPAAVVVAEAGAFRSSVAIRARVLFAADARMLRPVLVVLER